MRPMKRPKHDEMKSMKNLYQVTQKSPIDAHDIKVNPIFNRDPIPNHVIQDKHIFDQNHII
jgi:hypothetical protein